MDGPSLSKGPIGLGLGLLSIGRTWGHKPEPPPPEADARSLLEGAVTLGIRLFDTAPAYGPSERILGAFLVELGARRHELNVATKMGEHWDEAAGAAFTDHTYDALRRSVDHSLSLLGKIDVLQIHKSTAAVLRSEDVLRAVEYARSLGITAFGASVSDAETAEVARETGAYTYLQFPYNETFRQLEYVFDVASRGDMKVLVNRPFGMGRIFYDTLGDHHAKMVKALSFITAKNFHGHILTGTKSIAHLRETIRCYKETCRLM